MRMKTDCTFYHNTRKSNALRTRTTTSTTSPTLRIEPPSVFPPSPRFFTPYHTNRPSFLLYACRARTEKDSTLIHRTPQLQRFQHEKTVLVHHPHIRQQKGPWKMFGAHDTGYRRSRTRDSVQRATSWVRLRPHAQTRVTHRPHRVFTKVTYGGVPQFW